jgi:hypothetical protein
MSTLEVSESVTVTMFDRDGNEVEYQVQPGPLPEDLPGDVVRHLIDAGHAAPKSKKTNPSAKE